MSLIIDIFIPYLKLQQYNCRNQGQNSLFIADLPNHPPPL